MQQITLSNPALTMSSRDIADIIGKRHDNVMRDTRAMLIELCGESNLLRFEGVYSGGNGESRPCFNLPKRETLILVSGYSVALRAKIIDRWQELEAATADPMKALNDPATMRGLLLTYSETVLKLENKVGELAPKAGAFDRIATADGSMCVTDAAKALQMQPKRLFYWLQEHQWIYRRAGGANWIAYHPRIQSGLLTHKVTTVTRSDGTEKVVEQVLVTAKGLTALSASINSIAA